jgi:hypothetical protein
MVHPEPAQTATQAAQIRIFLYSINVSAPLGFSQLIITIGKLRPFATIISPAQIGWIVQNREAKTPAQPARKSVLDRRMQGAENHALQPRTNP